VGSAYGHGDVQQALRAMERLSKRYRCTFCSGVYFEDMADV
jgi:hypothetical protein